jgi:putative membrane-bound dehydrogenase-like protein
LRGPTLETAVDPSAETEAGTSPMLLRMTTTTVSLVVSCLAFGQGYSPWEAVAKMKIADGLQVRLVASEPLLRQPVAISFDDRGRLWALQYLQYPNPAGLKAVEVDRYLRTKYDRKPEPPPRGPKGADRLTILTDTDGDGFMDAAKDFLSGLNLATGFIHGYGGVFVLQAPYLLFYRDENGDDVPDGDPEVLLEGFGLEDAHALANSLTWGPDGWLYGAQGSTVTAHIRGITFQQGIWRYHPRTKKFELFAEGGGNTWGLDFNRWGDVIAGTNYGGAAMLHQVQGGYYIKGFEKHGPLQNPFTYGYFEHVSYRGFVGGHVTCGGVVYQGGALPAKFNDRYIAANLLSNAIHWHEIEPNKSTFTNRFGGEMLNAHDSWFRPIDCEVGPDGGVYVADWTDKRANHVDPQDDWDRTNGRIYAVEAKGAKRAPPFDLTKLPTHKLAKMYRHPNVWFERKARRILAERNDVIHGEALDRVVSNTNDEFTHKAFWALKACRGLTANDLREALSHANSHVRFWAVRFIGDDPGEYSELLSLLTERAKVETDCRVRSQLACTAKRLPAAAALAIVKGLATHTEDAADPFIPLLIWWAIERHCDDGRRLVLDWMQDEALWKQAIFREAVVPRLARRFASTGRTDEFQACAAVLDIAGKYGAFDAALTAAEADLLPMANTPEPIRPILDRLRAQTPQRRSSVQFGMKFHQDWAIQAANEAIVDANTPLTDRKLLLESMCRSLKENGLEMACAVLQSDRQSELHQTAVAALRPFADPSVGEVLLQRGIMTAKIRPRCIELLAARPTFAGLLLDAVEQNRLKPADVPNQDLQRIAAFNDFKLNQRMEKIWGKIGPESSGEKKARVHGIKVSLKLAKGDVHRGKELFKQHCGNCHHLFGDGAKIGPELTGTDRKNLDFLLTSMVDPSAVIRKEFMSHLVATTDGRTINGLIAEASPTALTLIDSKAQKIVVPQNDVEMMKPSPTSLMPERLLDTLDAQAVRDLVAYLQSDPPRPIATSRK